jgi:hypothetical protein
MRTDIQLIIPAWQYTLSMAAAIIWYAAQTAEFIAHALRIVHH